MLKFFAFGIKKLLHILLAMIIITLGSITADSLINNHISSAIAESISNSAKGEITVYRSPSCSCCGAWLEHVQQHGFKIREDIKTDDMAAIKQKYNLPPELESCHTAIVDGYVMEGHIPADDIKRFLKQKPQLAGLAVPGMPIGTPGMEMGEQKQPFSVVTFNKKGEVKVFKEYESY